MTAEKIVVDKVSKSFAAVNLVQGEDDPLETARRAEKTNGGDCRARWPLPARDRLQSFDLPAERRVA